MQRNMAAATLTNVPIQATAAGVTTINGASQNMSLFDAVRYTCVLGALTATQQTILKVQGSNDNATWFDLANTHVGPPADADSNYTLIVDLYRPAFTYLRPVVLRSVANAAIQCVIGDYYLASIEPVTPDPTNFATSIVAYAQAGVA